MCRVGFELAPQLGGGTYFRVNPSGSAVAIATPVDRKLDETRPYYGAAEEKEAQARKEPATDKLHTDSSVASRARHAAFNATDAGKSNLLGDKDLVEDVASTWNRVFASPDKDRTRREVLNNGIDTEQ
ncbi:hypothetical protein [Thiocapsa sp.]|uniref:hypothetical protein n=1 Tax=Thiocapsa sp. TaxID=2024551 RepID=UPI002BFF657F|nr:hypothetical protein [Thiocapsa sp.]HSO81660.1 hypothetical protein [Thiocapsa sp.]